MNRFPEASIRESEARIVSNELRVTMDEARMLTEKLRDVRDRATAAYHANGASGFYKQAFFILLSFILGNGLSFVVFGLHTVSKIDFAEFQTAVSQRLDQQDTHMQSIDKSFSNVAGQLEGKKLITIK